MTGHAYLADPTRLGIASVCVVALLLAGAGDDRARREAREREKATGSPPLEHLWRARRMW